MNATIHFLTRREAGRIFKWQDLAENIEANCITRYLLKVKGTALKVAEAVFFIAADRSTKTFGAMISVRSRTKEAFPR